MPARVGGPMMAVSASRLPLGPEWSYEVKWDGYRTIAEKNAAGVRLSSRNLKDLTAQYPSVARAVTAIRAPSATFDGEIVALDEGGRPSFQSLQHRTTGARMVYYVFDVLELGGRDLTSMPLDERRLLLGRIANGSGLLVSEPLPGTATQIEAAVRELGLEGVIAKRRDSRYEPGKRSPAWVKVKFSRRQEFVVGGFKPADPNFDSVLVGYFAEGRFLYAGKVRAGFTPHSRAALFAHLRALITRRCPFANLPNSAGTRSHWGEGITAEEMTTFRWVAPNVVVEVAFTEWTRDGNLRHASFVAPRDDKSPAEVLREP